MMRARHMISLLFILIIALGVASNNARARTAEEREAEIQERQQQRDTEISSRQTQRLKEINLRLEERYYIDIIRQVDAYSLDIYATLLPLVRRVSGAELRARNLIYNRLQDLGIALEPQPGRPLPDGIADFDVEEKFTNVQTCLDGGFFLGTNPPLFQTRGDCFLYNVPASGVAPDQSGLSTVPGPGFFNFNGDWPSFSSRLAPIGGAPIFSIGGVTLPPEWLPFLLPPFLPDGITYRPPNLPDSDPFTRDDLTSSITPYYSPNSPQILTGYASQCMRGVPARYFPEYYSNATGLTQAEIAMIDLNETIDTACPVDVLIQQVLIDLFTGFLNDLLGTEIGTMNTLPFPEYSALANNLAVYEQAGILNNTPFAGFQVMDYCAPLGCTFPDEIFFEFMIDIERNLFRSYVADMRNSVEILRQAYRALTFDIGQALAYHEYYLRNPQ